MLHRAQFIAFPLLLSSKDLYANWQINLSPGVTPISHDIFTLHMIIFSICVVIGVIVFGTIFYSILHHRKSLGVKPAKFHEHLWLEITWSLIPFLILVVMAIPATKVLLKMNDPAAADITIKVTGHQWKWEYDYLDQGIHFFSNNSTPFAEIHNQAPKSENYLRTVDHPLVVPIHKKIRFLFTSGDVIHAWFVPELGVQRDAVPGFINESWARINRPGIYYGQCNKLCGINHAYMPIVVMAISEKDFENWITQQKGGAPVTSNTTTTPNNVTTIPAVTPTPQTKTSAAPSNTATAPAVKQWTQQELMQRGEQIYLNTCSVCHQPDGAGMPPTFPALKGDKFALGPVEQHINRVLNGKPGTAMQAFRDQLSDEELAAVITYERNAFGNNTKDVVQPEQIKAVRAKPPLP